MREILVFALGAAFGIIGTLSFGIAYVIDTTCPYSQPHTFELAGETVAFVQCTLDSVIVMHDGKRIPVPKEILN